MGITNTSVFIKHEVMQLGSPSIKKRVVLFSILYKTGVPMHSVEHKINYQKVLSMYNQTVNASCVFSHRF